jgi:hypothetical protein
MFKDPVYVGVYQGISSEIADVLGSKLNLHAGLGVSTNGTEEVEVVGDWDEVGVCIVTSSVAGGNERGDGANGRLRCATGSRWNTK